MAEPGWYDDPLIPGGKRYWDGAVWTDTTQPPPAPAASLPPTQPPAGFGGAAGVPGVAAGPGPGGGGGMGGPPPFETLPPGAASTGGSRTSSSGLGDLGDWLNQTFRVLRDNLTAVLLLFFFLPAAFWAVAYLSFHQMLSNIEWADGSGFSSGSFGDASSVLLIVTIAAAVATVLAGIVGTLGGHHLLYGAHIGQTPHWGTSLLVGLKRLPRMLGVGLLIALAFTILWMIPASLVIFTIAVDNGSAWALGLLSVFLFLALIPAFGWLWVKSGFIWVSSAVTPSRTSALRSSMAISKGRFWAVFARLGILVAMSSMLSSVTQALAQFAAPVVLFSKFEFVGEDVLVNGQSADTIDSLRFGDILPNPIAALIYFTLYFLIVSAAMMLIASGSAAVYAQANGRNSFGQGGSTVGHDGIAVGPTP